MECHTLLCNVISSLQMLEDEGGYAFPDISGNGAGGWGPEGGGHSCGTEVGARCASSLLHCGSLFLHALAGNLRHSSPSPNWSHRLPAAWIRSAQ